MFQLYRVILFSRHLLPIRARRTITNSSFEVFFRSSRKTTSLTISSINFRYQRNYTLSISLLTSEKTSEHDPKKDSFLDDLLKNFGDKDLFDSLNSTNESSDEDLNKEIQRELADASPSELSAEYALVNGFYKGIEILFHLIFH
jgi:hypothetical protein